MKVFITGGTGYVGRHLIKHLLEEKHQIRALVRTYSGASKLKELGVDEVYIGDITKYSTIDGISEDIDVVFHLASVFLGVDYEKIVVGGTSNMIKAFRNSSIRSFVFTSFSPVYGTYRNDVFLKEDMVCHPNFKEAKYKLQADTMLLKAYHDFGFPSVVLRIPSIYGGDYSHFETIFIERIKNNQMVIFGKGDNKNSYVHIDDVIQALMLAATSKASVGEIFNIAGEDSVSISELYNFIAKNVGANKPKNIPIWASYIISTLSGTVARLQGKPPPLPRSLIKLLTLNGALDISKAKERLGYDPKYKNTLVGIRQSYFS